MCGLQQYWYNPDTKETTWFHPVTNQPSVHLLLEACVCAGAGCLRQASLGRAAAHLGDLCAPEKVAVLFLEERAEKWTDHQSKRLGARRRRGFGGL